MFQSNKLPTMILLTLLAIVASMFLLVGKGRLSEAFSALSSHLQFSVTYQTLYDAQEDKQLMQRAWIFAQQANSYDFHTEIEQTTYHAPALTNVGRPAQVDSVYLEGKTDRKARNFEVAIWQGGSLLDRERAYEVRTDGEQSYGRQRGGQWEKIEDITTLFAPNRDMLAYLHSVKNVHEVPSALDSYRQFQFDLDSPAFAVYMRQQLEDQLRRGGKLPPGITLDTPSAYQGVLGAGEIWLTRDGFPTQLHFTLDFPQQSNGQRVHAVIRTNFMNFETGQFVRADAPFGRVLRSSPLWLANQVGRLTLIDWSRAGVAFSSFTLFALCALLIVRMGRKRPIYIALNTAIIVSLVGVPLLQSAQAATFQQEQAAAQQEYEATQAANDRRFNDNVATWDPHQPPLALADTRAVVSAQLTQSYLQPQAHPNAGNTLVAQQTTPTAVDSDQDGVPDANEPSGCVGKQDCDEDTLTDLQETRLGTALAKVDTDNDKLRDDLEVKGYSLANRLWYSDPNNADTNLDGLPDTVECWRDDTTLDLIASPTTLPCNRDSDLDGTPDIFEYDNDGDGVDDSIDLSPFIQSDQVYNQQAPFSFQSNGLTPNEPLFVDFQLVPTSPNQISYARNVLDWPTNDTKGQVVRTQATTFATGKSSGSYTPGDETGDLRLMPLVEITIPAEDAKSILPATDLLTVTRTGTGYTEVMSVTQSSQAETTEQPWLHATVELRASQGNTTVAFPTLTDKEHAPTTVDKVQIFQSTCPIGSSETPVKEKTTTTGQGDLWALDETALPSLLDGRHVLLFLRTNSNGKLQSLCMPLGDVPNGTLPFWEMFDTTKLDAYGVSLRDSVNPQDNSAQVIAYLPANVVTGQTGGEKQAFSARMPYWPVTDTLGGAQQVRLVWLLQLLGDDGLTQFVHTYSNESWKLAGLSARQDIEMRSAVIYQNPDDDDNTAADVKTIHSRLWPTINVLDEHFAQGNAERLRLDDRLIPRLEAEFSAPAGALGAVVTTYQTQDEVARVPAEVTPDILAKFLSNGAYKAGYDHVLLIFAREETYKSMVWNGNNTLTLPATTDSLTSFSWKPFRHTADGWGAFPAREYLDLLHVRLKQVTQVALSKENLSDDKRAATLDGIVLANQAFAMGMLFGANRLVAVDNIGLTADPNEEDSLPKTIGENIVGTMLNTLAASLAEDLATEVGKLTNVVGRESVTALGAVVSGKFGEYKGAFGQNGKLEAKAGLAGLSIGVLSLALTIGKMASGNETAANVLDGTLVTLKIVAASMDTAVAYTKYTAATSGAGKSLAEAMKSAQPLTRAAKIAAVVGLVLTVTVAVGIFIAQWATGAFGLTSLGFGTSLSGVIAAVIVAVILVAISTIPIVGPIIVAAVALIDGLIAGICAGSKALGFDLEKASTFDIPRTAGLKISICAGITGLATELIRWAIYSQTVLVGNMKDSDRLTTSEFKLNLQDPNLGIQVGNSFRPSLRVDNKIELPSQPFDWKSAIWFWQFNWDMLDNATHRYDLATEAKDRDVSTAEMEEEWKELRDGKLIAHHSPGIHYDDPLVMETVTATLPAAQASIPFTRAGLNVPVSLYLREAYANPAQECVLVACYVRGGDTGTNKTDLGLAYDVFPASLDEFYASQLVGEGVSLAWGQSGDLKFPVMQDFDGDGLRASTSGGNDPDDRYWDADGDQLSDLFETQKGTQGHMADTDADGLDDRIELLIGSNPLQSDSDGDGLLDGAEIFHQDTLDRDGDGDRTEWLGGWEFVYDIVYGEPQKTWVTSDPLAWDADGDNLSDAQEQLYGLNPRVTSDTTVLKLNSQIAETHAPITLLRFEERTGATIFADASGQLNNALCRDNSCPAAGHEGKYTNGLLFDGVDDSLRLPEAVPLANHSFTIAFWLQRNNADHLDAIFTSGRPEANHGLGIGFDGASGDRRFNCGFYQNQLVEPEATQDMAWHHWACTYDVTTQTRTIYRDGAVVAQDSSVPYQGSGDWEIGGYAEIDNAPRLHGALDEFVVVPAALDASRIAALMEARYNPGGLQLLAGPGDSLSYAATLENNLFGQSLSGILTANAPADWKNASPLSTYRLAPQASQTLRGELIVGDSAASGTYSVTINAGAGVARADQTQANARPTEAVYLNFQEPQAANQKTTVHVGTPSTESGAVAGNALRLDGRTILDANDTAFDVSNTPFTFALWVRPDSDATGTRAIFGQPPAARDWQYTNSGVFLRIQDGRHLLFGWGDSWKTDRIDNVVTPGVWSHIVVTFDQSDVAIYVNGLQVRRYTVPNSRPMARQLLAIGDDNYCGEFELKNVFTVEDGDGPGSAEYQYMFRDERGAEYELILDENADTDDWEPGDGPTKGEIFNDPDKKQTFCGNGAHVYVFEADNYGSEDMGPNVNFDFTTPEHTGYNKDNYTEFSSPDIDGDGTVRFYYEIRNPVLPFRGSIDELYFYRQALTQKQVEQIYGGVELAYHYTFDDPPGAGLNGGQFGFVNEGGVAGANVNATCNQDQCPHSGVPGRINHAVSFDGLKALQIKNLILPDKAPGFSIWVKPREGGMALQLTTEKLDLLFRLLWLNDQYCINQSVCTDARYPAGQWAHLMVNFDEAGANLYVNGTKVLTDPAHHWLGANTYMLKVGDSWSGLIDDLRIPYDGSDVAAMMNAAPIVSLHLDEAGTAISNFENVGGSNATCSGTACPGAGRTGKVGQAAAFDGGDDGLAIPDSDILDLDHFTLAAWVKPTAGTNSSGLQALIVKSEEASINYAIYMDETRKIYASRSCNMAIGEVTSKTVLPVAQFTHVAATYDGKSLALYINGVLDASVQFASSSPCYNQAPLAIGLPHAVVPGSYTHYQGLLDEILVYRNALWDYQIKELYEAQANWFDEHEAHTVAVDAEPPTSSLAQTLPLATAHYANADRQLGVTAADASSKVALLEVGVSFNGGPTTWIAAQPCEDAAQGNAGSPAWCPWFKPSQWGGEGRYTLQTRATDAVGHRETPTAVYAILVDAAGPQVTVTQTDQAILKLVRNPQVAAAQFVPLDGSVMDPTIGDIAGSGVRHLWVTLRNAQGEAVGSAPYAATINGDSWSLQYPFYQAEVAGKYTLEVSAEDGVGNQSTLPARTFVLDGAPRSITLNEFASGLPTSPAAINMVTTTTIFQGWVSEYPLPKGVRFAYPFEENPGATGFTNVVATSGWITPSVATCSGNSCPVAGLAAREGFGIKLDGIDDYVALPTAIAQSNDFTFAAWVFWQGGEAWERIFDFGQDSSHYLFLTPTTDSGKLRFAITQDGIQGEQQLQTDTKMPMNEWVHVAVVLEGDSGRIFVNGVEHARSTITLNPGQVAGSNAWLGRSHFTSDPYFNGLLDQVVIYHHALSSDEVSALASTQVVTAQPQLGSTQSSSISFTPLWAAERSGILSPHLSPLREGQSLYLPLDETANPEQATSTYRNLAFENAESASCIQGYCPEPGDNSPAGGSADFDGVDDYISLPGNVKESDDFTFAAWVYWRGGQPWQRLFDFGQDENNYLHITPSTAENVMMFALRQAGSEAVALKATSPLPTERWVHVAVTLVGDMAYIYVNGVEQASGPITLDPRQIAGNNLWLGRSQFGHDPYFKGMMGDVRFFARGLSHEEIRSLWLGNRALLSLALDAPLAQDGNTLADDSGWHQPATLHSGTGDTGNKAVPGHQGPYALHFDGEDDYVSLSGNVPGNVKESDDFTFATWVYWRGGQPWQRIVDFGQDESNYLYITPSTAENVMMFALRQAGSDVVALKATSPLPTDQWVHVAVTLAGDMGQIYLNGMLQASGPIAIDPRQIAGENFWLGRSQFTGDPFFNGMMDDVRVYARALKADEINDLAMTGWRQVNVDEGRSNWSFTTPTGLEGIYRVDLLSTDNGTNIAYNPLRPAINYTIDTIAPRVTYTRKTTSGGNGNQYTYTFHAYDQYLSEQGFVPLCGENGQPQRGHRLESNVQNTVQLDELTFTCTLDAVPASELITVCDMGGNCTAIVPVEAQAHEPSPENRPALAILPGQPLAFAPKLFAQPEVSVRDSHFGASQDDLHLTTAP